jgi:HSP20 family protein
MLVPYRQQSRFPSLDSEFGRLLNSLARPSFDRSNIGESADSTAQWAPAVDIKELDDKIVLLADVPGVDPSEIELTVEDGYLTIKGERVSSTEKEENGYKRVERSHGTFLRRFALPDVVDIESIGAKGKNGVLEISIPKKAASKARRVLID